MRLPTFTEWLETFVSSGDATRAYMRERRRVEAAMNARRRELDAVAVGRHVSPPTAGRRAAGEVVGREVAARVPNSVFALCRGGPEAATSGVPEGRGLGVSGGAAPLTCGVVRALPGDGGAVGDRRLGRM